MSFLQSGSRSAFLSFPLGNSPSFSSGSLCCPLHRSNDGTTRIFLPFSKVCTLPYSSPFRPECSGVSDIPASGLPQLCTRCKGFSLHTLSYTSYRTGDCLFKKNLQHFAFFEQQKRVPAKMKCTVFRTIILWEHVLQFYNMTKTQLNRSSMTRAVFLVLRGSTPTSTTLTIGVKPIRLLTCSAMRRLKSAKSTSPVDST